MLDKWQTRHDLEIRELGLRQNDVTRNLGDTDMSRELDFGTKSDSNLRLT